MYTGSVSPIPYGTKVRKLYRKQFILHRLDEKRMFQLIEEGSMVRISQVVEFVDNHGSWLD